MPPLQMKALPPTLQQFLQNPSTVAAIASLGAHALLFGLLPLLPNSVLSAKEPDIKRSVGVVELTPAEQSRLPEISTAPLELPPIAQQPLPASRSLPSSGNYSLNPLPSIVPPAPGPFFPDSSTNLNDDLANILRQYSAAPPPRQPVLSTPPAPPKPAQTPDPKPANDRVNPQPGLTTDNQAINPSSTPSQQPAPSPQAANSQTPPRRSLNDEILARRNQIAQQLALLAPDATGTDTTGSGENSPLSRYNKWLIAAVEWLGEDYDGKTKAEQVEINDVPYPTAACLRELSGDAVVGVVVDGQGKVVADPVQPEILKGSGVVLFNQKALEAAASHQYQATGKKKAYRVLIKFDYSKEKCPAGGAVTPPAQG
ncbi:MAG TPA: energy transducer TonB [Coleofasciculaceae cyanobacterium]